MDISFLSSSLFIQVSPEHTHWRSTKPGDTKPELARGKKGVGRPLPWGKCAYPSAPVSQQPLHGDHFALGMAQEGFVTSSGIVQGFVTSSMRADGTRQVPRGGLAPSGRQCYQDRTSPWDRLLWGEAEEARSSGWAVQQCELQPPAQRQGPNASGRDVVQHIAVAQGWLVQHIDMAERWHCQEGPAGPAAGRMASTWKVPVPCPLSPVLCPKPSLLYNHVRPSAKQVSMNQSMFVPSQ